MQHAIIKKLVASGVVALLKRRTSVAVALALAVAVVVIRRRERPKLELPVV